MSDIVKTALPTYFVDDRHFIFRRRRWTRNRREMAGFVIDVLCEITAERSTGTLSFNITQGTSASAEFEEKNKIKEVLDSLYSVYESQDISDDPPNDNIDITDEDTQRALEKYRENRRRVAVGVNYISKYLREHPCIDCGVSDPDILEFDHVTGVKDGNVTSMAYSGVSDLVLQAEVEKCQIRCANCHSKRHAIERRNDISRPHYKDYFLSRH